MIPNRSLRGLLAAASLFFLGCSITAVRPSQEMSDMEVSIKAAMEVSADTLAPELFRLSNEAALLARKEYRVKNFEAAKRHADQARRYAERAEFEAIRNGAHRESKPVDPLSEPSYAPEPIATPPPVYQDAPADAKKPKTPGL